ncbi:hypothetical protein HYDPIDRAFT_41381 [Hydnomerulius pinastri MD-312]|uniref:Uncharacterized protein n=1 Tax=Hydnomerulius pinastri MD-312 TaxID=994086 RepID=A0A0C9VXW9_9AGAM|nr:hypothetical protein HYDPIDRAFT_41381 [Hydnomerulius pinastri MD-312]
MILSLMDRSDPKTNLRDYVGLILQSGGKCISSELSTGPLLLHTTMSFQKVALATLAAVAAVSACSYSNRGDGFEMYIYAETGCGTGSGYEQFWGSGDNPTCDCYSFASAMNDKMKSFTFTASEHHTMELYQNENCEGTVLGTTVGNWMVTSVSSEGQKASSFDVCLY